MTDSWKSTEATGLKGIKDVDRLIHEPARLIIMTILNTVAKADFLFLQRESGLTKGNLSAHLSRLEEAAYIEIEKGYEGKVPRTSCKILPAGSKAYKEYVSTLQGFLEK